MDLANLAQKDKDELARIAGLNAGNLQQALADAFAYGLKEGAIRMAELVGQTNTPQQNTQSNSDDDDADDGPLSAADAAWLRSQGIDPAKKFRVKNSVFTICGVRRSRWKYPVSAVNQNGTRYKFPINSIKSYQAR